jgi:hypothetical protein
MADWQQRFDRLLKAMTRGGRVMRCDQCKHWKPEGTQDWTAERVGFGECLGVRERWRITDEAGCRSAVKEYELGPPLEDGIEAALQQEDAALRAARAYVQDGSEYRAELFTAPDFFCALFAPPP